MKAFLVALLLTLSVGGLYGCASTAQPRGSAPLKTEGTTAPPPGCVDLRKRGGAC
ncbi:hypothetical protein LUCX_127 [Xanthomonas phage vB_XciM_LucasX]|nr:hypothetical protein LUCX_127 [Xanthomonas phage vB_XciM_LucasX]